MEEFLKDLMKSEGFRVDPYQDTAGKMTGGIGHLWTDDDTKNFRHEWTTQEKTDYWKEAFKRDIASAVNDVNELTKGWTTKPNKAQSEVLIDMRFNLGLEGLKKFENFLTALEAGDSDTAADEMLDSKWHKDFIKWNSGKDTSTLRSRRLETKMRGSN